MNITVYMSGTLDLFDVTCKQHRGTPLKPFVNGTKNGHIDGTCKRSLNEALRSIYTFCLHLYHSQIYTDFKPILSVKWSITIGTMVRFDGEGDGGW